MSDTPRYGYPKGTTPPHLRTHIIPARGINDVGYDTTLAPEPEHGIAITLPYPPLGLHPNRRTDNAGYARKLKADAKGWAIKAAVAALAGREPPRWPACSCEIIYRAARVGRRADPDNLVAWIKHFADGLTAAGIWRDDQNVEWLRPQHVKGDPAVVLIVRPNETSVMLGFRNDEARLIRARMKEKGWTAAQVGAEMILAYRAILDIEKGQDE